MTDPAIHAFLFERHPEPMWVFDRATLSFLQVNDSAIARFGYSRSEFLSMSIVDLRPEQDRDATRATLAELGEGSHDAGTWSLRCRSGELLPCHIHWHAVDVYPQPAVLASIRDDSQQRALELSNARLLEHETNLRTAQRLLGIGIWKMNLDTGRLDWSDSVFDMYGASHAGFRNSLDDYVSRVHPDDREQMRDNFAAFLASDAPDFHFEHRIVRDDGNVIHVRGVGEITSTTEGRILTGVVQDASEQVASEARLAQSASLVRIAGRTARLGGWRSELFPKKLIWTAETVAIHEEPPGFEPHISQALAYCAPEYREHMRQVHLRCAETGESFDEVLELITARGRRLWIRCIGEAERDVSGKVVALQGAFQDISELVESRERSERLADRLLLTLESISDAFFTLDHQWRFGYINQEAQRLLGQRADQLLDRSFWDAYPESAGSQFQVEYERAIETGETVRFTEHFQPLSRWFEVSAHPSADALAVYFRDVMAQREQTERLRLLEAAVSRMNDMLVITEATPIDGPEGPRIVYVNPAFETATGYPADQVLGRTPRMLQGPASQRSELQRIREALERFQPVRAEVINYKRNGSELWLELDIAPISDADGNYSHWVAVQRDITERKRAEQHARVSDERFRVMAHASKDVIWDWDIDTGACWWNAALCEVYGYTQQIEAGLESWTNRIHPDERSRVLRRALQALDGTASRWDEEYRFLHADGHALTVISRAYILRDDTGKAVRMLGSMIDISARREAEQRALQSQKLEAIGQLTGGVAHDFNNLLTVILGNAELLSQQLADQQGMKAMAEMTVAAAERAAELTSRLLAFARRQVLEPRAIDIQGLVANMEGLLRRTLVANINIRLIHKNDVWTSEVDPGQLETALLNLAINARDAMPTGGCLTVECANTELDEDYARVQADVRPGPYVRVSVSDTGSGMDAATVARAIEPFFTTKPIGKGSGLGLSMVYGFIKQSNGHLNIYSEPGAGTTIKLYLPRHHGNAVPLEKAAVIDVRGGSEHILVVEDDVLVREHLGAQLLGLGYRVSLAEDGSSALAQLRAHADIKLLFTDIIMPGGMNGRELADAAQALHPGLKVLFTSGYTENAIVHHGRLDQGVHLLSKPYRRQDMAIQVRALLDES